MGHSRACFPTLVAGNGQCSSRNSDHRAYARWRGGQAALLLAAVLCAAAATACRYPAAALTQLLEARRLASELHVQFVQAADAANRAVMADTDEGSAAAADEARRARQTVERNAEALQTMLNHWATATTCATSRASVSGSTSIGGSTTSSCRWPSRTRTSRRSASRSVRRGRQPTPFARRWTRAVQAARAKHRWQSEAAAAARDRTRSCRFRCCRRRTSRRRTTTE